MKQLMIVLAVLAASTGMATAGESQVEVGQGTHYQVPPSCLPGQTLVTLRDAQGRITGYKCAGSAVGRN